jgi:hypothetical protein
MTRRRRFAHGSSTGPHQMQSIAGRAVNAHMAVQAAAARCAAAIDDAPEALPLVVDDDDDSIVQVIDQARLRFAPA